MKLTPTGAYLSYARGTGKVYQWKVYLRLVNSLSLALTAGGWVDVTGYIYNDALPSFNSRIEYEISQFTLDSAKFEASNIKWWKQKFFGDGVMNDDYTYIELKVEFKCGNGTVFASDVMPVYCGFVDKVGIQYLEVEDKVTFNCYTVEDVGTRLPGENLTTRFINPSVDGAGTAGLVMQGIVGLYVSSANTGGKPLKAGAHTITYAVNGGNKQLKLDSGAFTAGTLGTGFTTIGDVDNGAGDTQKLQVYVSNTALLPASGTWVDYVVVTVQGVTLPTQWYRNVTARFLLDIITAQMGITAVAYDTMEMNTYDGQGRITNFDVPPNDVGITGNKAAMVSDGTDLYLSVGNKIYKKTLLTGVYTLMTTVPVLGGFTPEVERLWYSSRNNDLFIVYKYLSGHSYECFRRYNITANFLSGEAILTADSINLSSFQAMEMLERNYTGSAYKYGLIYANNEVGFADIYYIDALTFVKTACGTGLAPSTSWPFRNMMIRTPVGSPYDQRLWYRAVNGGNDNWRELTVNAGGSFVDNGVVVSAAPQGRSAFNVNDQRVMCQTGTTIVSFPLTTYSPTVHAYGVTASNLIYSNGYTYLTESTTPNRVWRITALGGVTLLGSGPCDASTWALAAAGGKLYGITTATGTLWLADYTIPFRVPVADFGGTSVRDAWNKVLKAFNLVGIISGDKTASVFRRGDSYGTPQTSGNTLSIGVGDIEKVTVDIFTYQSYDLVKITTQSTQTTFDGTNFNSLVLGNKVVLEVNNNFLFDNVARDFAVYAYNFFSRARSVVTVRVGVQPLFHYEVFDNINFAIGEAYHNPFTVGGPNNPIYSITYERDGSMEIQFLLSSPDMVLNDIVRKIAARNVASSWVREDRYQLLERRRERFPR